MGTFVIMKTILSPISLDTIFTEYDDSIAAEISRDPLGMQSIWTSFGQRIFEKRTTSVATDIRNYTINLFHHYVINRYFMESSNNTRKILGTQYLIIVSPEFTSETTNDLHHL